MIELIVVLAVCLVLLSMLWPRSRPRNKASRISCVNNLKQIGTAYRVWADDNNDCYPFQAETNGGWKTLLANRNQGSNCWKNFVVMSNELGQSPRILACPADERQRATNFTRMSNTNVSYFIGVGASVSSKQSILAGDRNLGRGLEADRGYGFSPADGRGEDVAIQTNSAIDPLSFSLKMHSKGNTVGAGNVLLSDGSVQQVSSSRFRTNLQPFFSHTNNWPQGQVPGSPSFRLIFP